MAKEPPRFPSDSSRRRPEQASVLDRTLKGVVLAGCLLGLLWLDYSARADWLPAAFHRPGGAVYLVENGLFLVLPLLLFAATALIEYKNIVSGSGAEADGSFMILTGFAVLLTAWPGLAYQWGNFYECPFFLRQPGFNAIIILCVAMMGSFIRRLSAGRIEGGTTAVSADVLGVVYVVFPLLLLTALRIRWGTGALLMTLAVCKCTDVGAYYLGKTLGGPRLAPAVSPNKTWAGVVGGVSGAILAALVLQTRLVAFIGPGAAIVFGLTVAVVAIMGDLAESLLKREAGAKDSGRLLKGYGGVLDMIDDVLFAAPWAYVFLAVAEALGA